MQPRLTLLPLLPLVLTLITISIIQVIHQINHLNFIRKQHRIIVCRMRLVGLPLRIVAAVVIDRHQTHTVIPRRIFPIPIHHRPSTIRCRPN